MGQWRKQGCVSDFITNFHIFEILLNPGAFLKFFVQYLCFMVPHHCHLQRTCKENPFNRKTTTSASSFVSRPPKGPRPARPPAPGHGFPLIKRKVRHKRHPYVLTILRKEL